MKGNLNHIKEALVISTSTAPTWYLKWFCGNGIGKAMVGHTLKGIGIAKRRWLNYRFSAFQTTSNQGNTMPQKPASPTLRDWLLLIGGSTYKFTLTGFYLVALVAILKNHSYSLDQLSWIHLIGGIEAAKVLFAALMERRPAGRFGRFRGWLLAATLGLSAVFGLMACTDITQHFALLLTCCVLLSAMSAVYGCAMLGLSCIVLPHRERGFGGVIQTMAARGGKMIGGALVLWLYQEYG